MGRGRTAETILNATIRLFLETGAKKTTMDDIAERAAVSKVTVYKYFADKDALYEQAGKQLMAGFLNRVDAVVSSESELPRKLAEMIDCVTEFTDSGRYELCCELARYNEATGGEFLRFKEGYRSAMMALIDEGLEHGMFREGLDRDMVFYYVDMGVSYYQLNRQYRGRMTADAGFRERYMGFLLSGLFAKAN